MSDINKVIEFLIEQQYMEAGQIPGESESLLELGLIDSVGILNLIAFLEETFRFKVEDAEMLPENFESLGAIKHYVSKRKPA